MGRMHSKGKGMSSSALPYKRSAPSWLKTTSQEVVDTICKFAKKGMTPSQIGVALRDSHGIPQVRAGVKRRRARSLRSLTRLPGSPGQVDHRLQGPAYPEVDR